MKIGIALPAMFAFGLIAVAVGCKSSSSSGEVTTYRATVVGRFEAPHEHLAIFDVTVTPGSPPSGTTSMDIEVRAGPATSQLHLIGNEIDLEVSEWVRSFNDHGYGGEKTYFVEITVYFQPDSPADVRTYRFSSILYGSPQTGTPYETD